MDRSMVIAKGRTKQLADGSVLYRFGDEQTPSAGLDQVERETQEQIAYCEQNGSHDLLVVGPGVLGSLVALGWKSRFPEAKVVGQTNTNQAHERLRSLGVEPRTKFERDATQFPYVVFSAPPSGSEDYPQEITDAVKLWNGKGGFVFTSSAGVYLENNLGSCKESSPLQLLGSSERLDKLLLAEEIVHKVGGNVLRLAGLYTADRGAHMFFLKAGQVPRTGDNVINLIHNEDAASLTISTLLSSKKAKYYLGCDNHPITLSEMMDIILTSGKYEGSCEFVGKDPPTGKCLNNDKTREELSWSPKHESFQSFVNKI